MSQRPLVCDEIAELEKQIYSATPGEQHTIAKEITDLKNGITNYNKECAKNTTIEVPSDEEKKYLYNGGRRGKKSRRNSKKRKTLRKKSTRRKTRSHKKYLFF